MMANFWEKAASYEARVSQGFSTLKPCNYTVLADEPIHSVRQTPKDVSRIKQILFGSFSKCLYPLQKFDSDTERRFAVILERDAQKWFKPAQGQFQIYWKSGFDSKEYIPDFVVETEDSIWLVETKAGKDLKILKFWQKLMQLLNGANMLRIMRCSTMGSLGVMC